jgi:4-alpha-glucanotransferase
VPGSGNIVTLTPEQLRAGLATLGVKRLLLAIHDVSFPSDPDEDIGRGSPATKAAQRLFGYARGLGFTGVQLGPQGQTSRSNPSPYDGTIFSRNVANISLHSFRRGGAFEGLVARRELDVRIIDSFGPAQHRRAHDVSQGIIADAYRALRDGARPDVQARLSAFMNMASWWLVPDALYAAIFERRGVGHREWPAVERHLWLSKGEIGWAELLAPFVRAHEAAIERYALGQLLVHDEHERVRSQSRLQLYGDMQIGYSDTDAWRHAATFLRGYAMGAPPSRTNPDGQPWGYPVLDPDQLLRAAGALVIARAEKAFAEYDSIRIDHPHGLVCPWVYRSDTGDDAVAVREGGRLFESPDLDDHPALAAFAIVRPDQIDRTKARYHDSWVSNLDDDQVARYAVLLDAIVEAAKRAGRSPSDISCEVLSTMPAPLGAVLRRHGLGRWRVTQKANLDDPTDVYRSENAQPDDWVMLGNHDTAPILTVIRGWAPAQREKWARHLAATLKLLRPERLASDGFTATAMLAELFASRAQNVSIFFADLFGYTERFNVPGLVDDANWALRLPHDFERLHAERLAREEALDLPLAVELALAATPGRN